MPQHPSALQPQMSPAEKVSIGAKSETLPHFAEESEREETCASLPRVLSSLLGTFIQHGRKRMKKAEVGPRVTSQDPDTSAENTDKPLINYEANVRNVRNVRKTPEPHKENASIALPNREQDLAPGSGYKHVTAGTRKHL